MQSRYFVLAHARLPGVHRNVTGSHWPTASFAGSETLHQPMYLTNRAKAVMRTGETVVIVKAMINKSACGVVWR